MEEKVLTFFGFCFPALIVGIIAYYFFSLYVKNEENRRIYLLHKKNQKISLPLRMQAYERMALFLERINPQQLLVRIPAKGISKNEYENILINTIDEEFQHNTTQQVYMSDELWNIIKAAKGATIQTIRKIAHNAEIGDTQAMTEAIFKEFVGKPTPSASALSMLKDEVRKFLK